VPPVPPRPVRRRLRAYALGAPPPRSTARPGIVARWTHDAYNTGRRLPPSPNADPYPALTSAAPLSVSRPRILQVIAPAPFGGAESVARSLGRAYAGDHRLVALIQRGGNHPFVEESRADGIDITEIVAGRRRYDREVAALGDVISSYRPDVVHTHIYHADFVGYFAARRFGVPVVAHAHGFTGGDWKDRLYQWLDLRLLRRFAAIVCVSDSVRERLLEVGCPANRIHLIPNPWSGRETQSRERARSALGIDGVRPVLGWVGRLGIEKGADLFVEAIHRLPPPRPLALIVGDGPEMPAVRARIAALGLEGDIRLTGSIPDATDLLRAFDALVLSSRTEGTPMTMLEAMGAAVPVVAFAVGGIPEAVSEKSAWLAEPANVESLASAIRRMLENSREATTRSAEAARIVRGEYGIEQWEARLASVYRSVCGA
jgi:glycosyltransferase involved in cell wall biosynthesis